MSKTTKCIDTTVIATDFQKSKTPIEFSFILVDGGTISNNIVTDPEDYDNIELLMRQGYFIKFKGIQYNNLDVMMAYDDGSRNDATIFFGHWNDGVV